MAHFTLKRAAKYNSMKRGFRPCGRFGGLMMSRLSKQEQERDDHQESQPHDEEDAVVRQHME